MAKKISDANNKKRYNILNKREEVPKAPQEELDNTQGRVLYNEN